MDIRIGNSSLNVEGVRQLKNDVKLDENLKTQLAKDGYDEVVFQKGDEVFVAYGKNMDLEQLNVNFVDGAESFNEDSAYEQGQLSVDGNDVKVLHKDDENKKSLWAASYTGASKLGKEMVNSSEGRSALIGVATGASMAIANKYLPKVSVTGYYHRSAYNIVYGTHKVMSTPMKGIVVGSAVGALAGGIKGSVERGGDCGSMITAAVGYGAGYVAGVGATTLIELAAKNPKTTAATVGLASLTIGTSVLLDKLADNNKASTLSVINKIAQ